MITGLKVTPIVHNLFLFEMPSRQEAVRVKAGDWYWNGRRLSLEWWSAVTGLAMAEPNSERRWIKAFGIPLHAWLESSFRVIGELCGGFVDTDEDTKKRTHLHWARICVNKSIEEIPSKLELKVGELSYEISIISDAYTKLWVAGDGVDCSSKGFIEEEGVRVSRSAAVKSVDRPQGQHMPLAFNSKLSYANEVGPYIRFNNPAKGASIIKDVGPKKIIIKKPDKGACIINEVGPSNTKKTDQAYYNTGLKRINKKLQIWKARTQDP